jgi:hypothetical protein
LPGSLASMNIQEMVRELTRNGVVVTPDMLSRMRNEGPEAFSILLRPKDRARSLLTVKTRVPEALERMSASDFAAYYADRHRRLSSVLLKRMDVVSINKAGGFGEVSVAGMVKERSPQGFVLEDTTGEIQVISREQVSNDDVLGVRGAVREGKLLPAEIVWPDIHPEHKAAVLPETTILLSGSMEDAVSSSLDGLSLAFIRDGNKHLPEGAPSKLIACTTNPYSAGIVKGDVTFNLLAYAPPEAVSPSQAVEFLKKRHLGPRRERIRYRTDPFVIEPVPDLFWVISDSRHIESYRGVAIVMAPAGDAVIYDAGQGKARFERASAMSKA